MLFFPLACMVIDPAPLWPLFPAAKKTTVFCAVRTAHAHRLVRYRYYKCTYHFLVQVSVRVLAAVVSRSGVIAAPRVGPHPGPCPVSGSIESVGLGYAEASAGLAQVHEGQQSARGHPAVLTS